MRYGIFKDKREYTYFDIKFNNKKGAQLNRYNNRIEKLNLITSVGYRVVSNSRILEKVVI